MDPNMPQPLTPTQRHPGRHHGLSGNTAHSDQNVSWKQHSPQAFTWFPVASQIMDIHVVFDGNSDHRLYHRPSSCSRTVDTDMALGGSPGPGHHHGLRWLCNAPHIPLFLMLSNFQFNLSVQCTDPLTLRSLPSLHCVLCVSHIFLSHGHPSWWCPG